MLFRHLLASFCAVLALGAASFAYADNSSRQSIWLDAHNDARTDFGSEPLVWSRALEREAYAYARELAQQGILEHSPYESRNGQGENLWMGTKRYFSPQRMMADFIDERRFFRAGKFPNVSTTPNWEDVGHYTQIVWRETREVGCASAEGPQYEVLVCRYYPAGNVLGQYIAPQPHLAQRYLDAN
jgi:hypothetical protein